ncbi:hypothetical protein DID88_003713 [Monilinia fructigena]|uniref:Uncharacterized protein n=1 Tax=Monilinia fructigena TaxID=38457 RepID=A0A395ITN1_9HELO|nr:hypothetical protein DID88_003713 [Monilinia fructigena]
MDEATKLVGELSKKLSELDHKVDLYRNDMKKEYIKYEEDLLRNIPQNVSKKVSIIITDSLKNYKALYPFAASNDVVDSCAMEKEKEQEKEKEKERERGREGERERERERERQVDTGTGTDTDTGTSTSISTVTSNNSSTSSIITTSNNNTITSLNANSISNKITNGFPKTNVTISIKHRYRYRYQPNPNPNSNSNSNISTSVPIIHHNTREEEEIDRPRSPHAREKEFTGVFTPSYLPLLDSNNRYERRSQLQEYKSSKVRFDVEGEEVLPTSSPKELEPILPPSFSDDSDDEAGSEMVEDIDAPPPKRISSSQALRALSRGPPEDDDEIEQTTYLGALEPTGERDEKLTNLTFQDDEQEDLFSFDENPDRGSRLETKMIRMSKLLLRPVLKKSLDNLELSKSPARPIPSSFNNKKAIAAPAPAHGIVGSYKGRSFSMPVVNVNDVLSFRASGGVGSYSGTPKSMSERMMLDDLMEAEEKPKGIETLGLAF